jgi:hypothetical protein
MEGQLNEFGSHPNSQGRSLRAPKLTRGVRDGEEGKTSSLSTTQEELLKDVAAGMYAISRFTNSNWWTWHRGSALFFWHWTSGEQREFARDGMPVWVKSRLPKYQQGTSKTRARKATPHLGKNPKNP